MLQDRFPFLRDWRVRVFMASVALIIVVAEIITVVSPYFSQRVYALGSADSLLLPINQIMANELQFNKKEATFDFNQGYKMSEQPNVLSSFGKQITATAYQDPSKGIIVSDPANQIDFSISPKFSLWAGKQDGNRIVYPFKNGSGWVVYSMHSVGVKEDVVLRSSDKKDLKLDYNLHMGDNLQARIENDGSIGVYGNRLFSGNISTGSTKDTALLEKARENAPKDTLLFDIPAPTIKEFGGAKSGIRASYSLDGDTLRLSVKGLNKANYPLSIDPSIYVESAEQFMRGNNETNIDFDVADSLIQKGSTTGARFDSWDSTMNMNAGVSGLGAAAAGGYIYTVGGTQSNGSTSYYTSPGSDTYTVPSGVTSITVKSWGGGGGGGGGGTDAGGGNGGGSGYSKTTLSVTPGEVLDIYVGSGGTYGSFSSGSSGSSSGDGGGGGGYSGVFSSGTPLLVAPGGGGGGGGDGGGSTNYSGGAGGAGGGTSGVSGSSSNAAGGGGAGTSSSGGSAGSGGNNSGAAGGSLSGGAGADGANSTRGTGSSNNGGSPGGADGGNGDENNNKYAGGAGGGGGYYGGGGGSGAQSSGHGSNTEYTGGGGGGGGSSYTSGTSSTNTAGSGTTPGNSSDGDRGSAGNGGSGGSVSGAGTSGNSGLVVISYGSGATNLDTVSWAKFNTVSGAINSANPGAGVCSGWCSKTAYSLPAPRKNLSLVAYNGFLYAIGGEDSGCTSGNGTGDNGVCSTVYIAKLGANGEPQLWSPTSTDKGTWTYWYRDSDLSSPRSYTAAVAYENRMYLLGGKTSTSGTVSITNTAQIADITPTGKIGSWSSSTTLPYNVYGQGAQVYNGRIYIVGGASSVGGSPLDSVYYNYIDSDGTLNDWVQTSSLTGGRFTNGGNFTTVWGGYMYLSGGCSALNGSGYCTSVASDTQLTSINADGSLDQWNTMANVSDGRMGHDIVAWRGNIYELGGCSSQSSSTGECSTTLDTINYGTVNSDGDISTVSQSQPSGTAPCSGGSPYGCDLPPLGNGAGQGGQMLNATAVINGYLYVAGGCVNAGCTNVANNTSYIAISSDGTLTAPANCTTDGNTLYGAWCVDSTHTINFGNNGAGKTGVAAAGTAVFNNTIYFVGGINGNGLTDQVYHISVNSDGSLNSGGWAYDSITTAGATSVAYDFAYARANPSSAGSAPGNLYILGGCDAVSNASCTSYTDAVYKCDIQTSGTIANCSTSGQLQIGTVSGASSAGLAGVGGTVYANYIYLIGGRAPGASDLDTVYYAKLNNSNNIVAVSGSSWTESTNSIPTASEFAYAFGYNGYLYVVGGYNSTSGVLGGVEFAKVNVSDGSINAFTTSSVSITPSWGMGVPVSGAHAYVLGGCSTGAAPASCSNLQATVQTFEIYNNDSGSPAGYSTASHTYGTSSNRIGAGSTILDGYIYVAGGCTSTTDCTTAINDVSYAPIDADGNIGTWSSTSASLPAVRAWGKLEAAGGSLYYIGGQNSSGTGQSQVYYATPSSGDVSSWTQATNGLPSARTKFGATVWNDRLYVAGGLDGSSATTSTVYVSPDLSSGGDITSSWSTSSTSFNVARSGLTAIAYANNLYIFGGYDGSHYLSDSQYAQISTSTGNAGSWSYTTSLPTSLSGADGFAANGYIYLLGGTNDGTSCRPRTLLAPISANTTITSGNNPTGIGEWYETNQRYSGDRYGAAAVYNDGKAYVLGGACGTSSLTYASPVSQQTSLLSQPQVARYSIMLDTDTDVFPETWLLNGIDNSIGAKWQLSYRSMTNTTTSCTSPAMTTWGQTTNFGDVILGTPGVYNPLDGSGSNTNCARFFYLSVTVDSSHAYGYPDDVSRGPTITDLTLQFTADPDKRLMHGRTFTGGLQQPDDTPYYDN